MADEIRRLRELLEAADASAQAQLGERLQRLEHGLPQQLPEALRQADRQGPALSAALEAPLARVVEQLARRRRDLFAEALFPVLGPAIRKAITAALRQLVDNLNRLLESTFTVRGLRWRLQAWRSGMPYAQVALRHLLRYSVDHLFLVQNGSGLLLGRAQQQVLEGRDTDAVAAMLTALRDFSRDAGLAPEDAELDEVTLGEHLLRLYPGPEAYLAAAISGVPGESLDGSLAELLEAVHAEQGELLAAGNADAALDVRLQEWLEQSGQAQALQLEREQKRPWMGLGVMGLLLLAALLVAGEWLWTGREASRLQHALAAEDGLVVEVSRSGWRQLQVTGLRDPLAPQPQQVAQRIGLSAHIDSQLSPYLALDDALQLQRLQRALDPPAEVQLSLQHGQLSLLGRASVEWIEQARPLAQSWPGLQAVDWQVERWPPAPAPLLRWQIQYAPAAVMAPEALPLLRSIVATLPAQGQLHVEAETDGSGSLEHNRELAAARMDWVSRQLQDLGMPPQRIVLGEIRARVVEQADDSRRRVLLEWRPQAAVDAGTDRAAEPQPEASP